MSDPLSFSPSNPSSDDLIDDMRTWASDPILTPVKDHTFLRWILVKAADRIAQLSLPIGGVDKAVNSIYPDLLEPLVRGAADDFYARVLDGVQNYLVDNARFNLGETLASAKRQRDADFREIDRLNGNAIAMLGALKATRAIVAELSLKGFSCSVLCESLYLNQQNLTAAIAKAEGADQ